MSLIIDASPFPSVPYISYDIPIAPIDIPLSTNSIPSSINPPSQPAPAASNPLSSPPPETTPIQSQPQSSAPKLPQSAIIVLLSTIPIVAALVLIMGIIHCVRRRNKRRIAAQQQADIEKSLETGRRPVLVIDTDVPVRSGRSGSWSAGTNGGRVQTPGRGEFGSGVAGGMGGGGGEVPPVPKVPQNVYGGSGVGCGGGTERPRAWTRKSISLPGVSGR